MDPPIITYSTLYHSVISPTRIPYRSHHNRGNSTNIIRTHILLYIVTGSKHSRCRGRITVPPTAKVGATLKEKVHRIVVYFFFSVAVPSSIARFRVVNSAARQGTVLSYVIIVANYASPLLEQRVGQKLSVKGCQAIIKYGEPSSLCASRAPQRLECVCELSCKTKHNLAGNCETYQPPRPSLLACDHGLGNMFSLWRSFVKAINLNG